MKKYDITVSINKLYLIFFAVTIYSLLKNNQKAFFNIHILHNNCLKQSDITNMLLKYPLNQYNNFQVHLIDVSIIKEVQEFKVPKRHAREIYFKVFLPILLPNVDKVFHLDVDIIVKKDISDIFEINLKDYMLYADGDHRNKNTTPTIWGGVILFNLKKARREDFTKKLVRYIVEKSTTEDIAFNYYYKDNFLYPPQQDKNPIFTTSLHKRGNFSKTKYEDIKIIHYTASKPYLIEKRSIQYNYKCISEYWKHLEEFVDKKYKYRFILLKFYIFTLASFVGSLARNYKRKVLKIEFTKSNIVFNKIQKYTKDSISSP